ncbi:hypothetical protein GCM10025784_11400 [Citricoccus nitrophenolicus]
MSTGSRVLEVKVDAPGSGGGAQAPGSQEAECSDPSSGGPLASAYCRPPLTPCYKAATPCRDIGARGT